MPKGMSRHTLGDSRGQNGLPQSPRVRWMMKMVAAHITSDGMNASCYGWEQVLPTKVLHGRSILLVKWGRHWR